MLSSKDTPLELQTQLWKNRAQAKQQWLEHSLAEPVTTPEESSQRAMWIKRALKMVKQGQDEIKYQTALLDAYAAHLNAIEMTLIGAAEKKTPAATST